MIGKLTAIRNNLYKISLTGLVIYFIFIKFLKAYYSINAQELHLSAAQYIGRYEFFLIYIMLLPAVILHWTIYKLRKAGVT